MAVPVWHSFARQPPSVADVVSSPDLRSILEGDLCDAHDMACVCEEALAAVSQLCGVAYPLALVGDDELAGHVSMTSVAGADGEFVDFEFVYEAMRQNSSGQAVLCWVELDEIQIPSDWRQHHAPVPSKEAEYAQLDARAAPPILLYEDGELADGYHRYRNAVRQGVDRMLAYVCVDQDLCLDLLSVAAVERNRFGGYY